MLNKIKEKSKKILVPLSVIAINTSVVFAAEDDLTRKMDKAKIWIFGLLTVGAIVNVAWAVFKAGRAEHQSDIEKTEKYRSNAIWGLVGVLSVDILVSLWNSW